MQKHTTDSIADEITVALKLLNIRIDDKAGNIINADISKDPINLIPNTIVSAVSTAVNILYRPVLIPVAFEKFSSKVTANIFT